jgi:hypothetical protein
MNSSGFCPIIHDVTKWALSEISTEDQLILLQKFSNVEYNSSVPLLSQRMSPHSLHGVIALISTCDKSTQDLIEAIIPQENIALEVITDQPCHSLAYTNYIKLRQSKWVSRWKSPTKKILIIDKQDPTQDLTHVTFFGAADMVIVVFTWRVRVKNLEGLFDWTLHDLSHFSTFDHMIDEHAMIPRLKECAPHVSRNASYTIWLALCKEDDGCVTERCIFMPDSTCVTMHGRLERYLGLCDGFDRVWQG